MEKVFRLAELFCGPGGLAVGALNAVISTEEENYRIEPVWANDIDSDTCDTYAYNIHKRKKHGEIESVVNCDVREIKDFKSIPKFDSLAFGFPCNDFSIVGETLGFKGKYGPLYLEGVRAIDAHNPQWFLAENVGGLQSANEGKAFKKIISDLENSGVEGYHLVAHKYKFEEYGVPQQRHRIIIVGIRNDLDVNYKVPKPTFTKDIDTVSVSTILARPDKFQFNCESTSQSKRVVDRLNCIPEGENAWYLDKILSYSDTKLVETVKEHLPNFKKHFGISKLNGQTIREIIEEVKLNVKSARMSQIYKRLRADKPSYTITGSGGGGTHVYHWSEPRALTNRERARIQTFPDNHFFCGSKESVRKQIGMAVPPLGAEIIFRSILKAFAGIKYEYIDANLYQTTLNYVS